MKLQSVPSELIKHYMSIGTKLSADLTRGECQILLDYSENKSLPRSFNSDAFQQLHDMIKQGISDSATDDQRMLAKIMIAAVALKQLHPGLAEEIKNAIDKGQKELNLSKKQLTDTDIKLITQILPASEIISLNVASNKFGMEGIKALAADTTLKLLDISNNSLRDSGAKVIATNKTLLSLTATHNLIGPEGGKALALNNVLQILNLKTNTLQDGVAAFGTNTTLKSLNVEHNFIGPGVAVMLAASPSLEYLNISNNSIGDVGVIALASSLTLRILEVSRTGLSTQSINALAANRVLESLNIRGNSIGDNDAIALATANTLQILNAEFNNIGDPGAIALGGMTSLRSLNIKLNKVTDIGAKALAANPNLENIEIENTAARADNLPAIEIAIMLNQPNRIVEEDNPTTRYNAGKSVGMPNLEIPTLRRLSAFSLKKNPEEKAKSDETLPQDLKDLVNKKRP